MQTAKAIDLKRLASLSGVILVVALTLLSGVIQGRMSNRWGPPRDVLAAAKKLDDIPSRLGNWQLESSEEMSRDIVDMLECTGYLFRTYVNQQTGQAVRVSVLVGPSGPMSVHTPEICYSSRDYTIREKRHRVPIDVAGSGETFWALTFRSNDLDADTLRVYYAWNAGGHWSAPEDSRFAFARYPFLYKIQLASYLSADADPETADPCREFLTTFVPLVKPYLAKAS